MPNLIQYVRKVNKNTLKSNYNRNIDITDKKTINQTSCDCRRKNECPLNGFCKGETTTNVIYEYIVEKKNKVTGYKASENYMGSTIEFKQRYLKHKSNLNSEKKSTTLAAYIKEINNNVNESWTWKWRIIEKVKFLDNGNGDCNLCAAEKMQILKNKPTLNKMDEILNACQHNSNPVQREWRNRFKKALDK